MTRLYRSREGEATALSTRSQLTTLGSEQSPGPLLVPSGVTKIVGVIIAAMENFAAATSYSAFVRLEGPGLPGGPETIAAAAGGVGSATGGNFAAQGNVIPLDIDVLSGNEILIYGEMAGTDIGQVSFGVTLIFS